MTKPAGHDTSRVCDSRISASPRPKARPQVSDVPVILSVFARPSANRSVLAKTGAKFH